MLLAGLGAAPLLARDAAPIRKVDVFPVSYPVTAYFKFFTKPERHSVFVKVTCEDGTVGWGQSVPLPTWSYETMESAASTLRDLSRARADRQEPRRYRGRARAVEQDHRGIVLHRHADHQGGLDLALHDIAGKLRGKSIAEWWGRKPLERITLSWTVNVKAMAEVEPLMAEGRKRGYRNFNIKVAPDPKFDLALAKEVRRLAPEGFLWADANGGYDTGTALTAAPQAARRRAWMCWNSPWPPNNLSGLAAPQETGRAADHSRRRRGLGEPISRSSTS